MPPTRPPPDQDTRLSAFLMIFALVAALVPSAVLAGKPAPPSVSTVSVLALNSSSTTDICRLNVSATFVKGKAVYSRFAAVQDGVVVSTPTPTLSRTATSDSQIFEGVTLGGNVWSFKVQLLDRKYNVLAEAQTDTEDWTSTTSCPPTNEDLATYPF